jgi:hypothetical protein
MADSDGVSARFVPLGNRSGSYWIRSQFACLRHNCQARPSSNRRRGGECGEYWPMSSSLLAYFCPLPRIPRGFHNSAANGRHTARRSMPSHPAPEVCDAFRLSSRFVYEHEVSWGEPNLYRCSTNLGARSVAASFSPTWPFFGKKRERLPAPTAENPATMLLLM